MRLETVAESFATYRQRVIPRGASETQVNESRRAFYAGVYFWLMNLMHNIGDDDTSEDEGVAELEKLKTECERFAAAGGMPLPTPTMTEDPAPVRPPDDYATAADANEVGPMLRAFGRMIGDDLPEGWGFNLLLFPFGEGRSLFYISNADRGDVMAAMREFLQKNTQ